MTGTEGRGPVEHGLDEDDEDGDPKTAGYSALFRLAGRIRELDDDAARLADDTRAQQAATRADDTDG